MGGTVATQEKCIKKSAVSDFWYKIWFTLLATNLIITNWFFSEIPVNNWPCYAHHKIFLAPTICFEGFMQSNKFKYKLSMIKFHKKKQKKISDIFINKHIRKKSIYLFGSRMHITYCSAICIIYSSFCLLRLMTFNFIMILSSHISGTSLFIFISHE